LNLKIDGNINNSSALNKYSRYYVNLNLERWHLQKGIGSFFLNIKIKNRDIRLESEFNINKLLVNGQIVNLLRGQVNRNGKRTNGRFVFHDPYIQGEAQLSLDKDAIRIDFKNVHGEAVKALKMLALNLSLKGKFQGDFRYDLKFGESNPKITGQINSPMLDFYGFHFNNLSTDLTSDITFVSLKNLQFLYMDGNGKGDILIDYGRQSYRLNGMIKGADLSRLARGLNGAADITFNGEGTFNQDPINLEFQIDRMFLFEDKQFHIIGKGKIKTDFSGFAINLNGDLLHLTDKSPFSLSLQQKDGIFNGSYNLQLKDINLMIPWGFNKGEVFINGEISTTDQMKVHTQGYVNFSGERLTFPNFPHTLDNFYGRIMYRGMNFNLQTLQGTVGGGKVESSGSLTIQNGILSNLEIHLEGRDMVLYPMERTSFTINTRDLNLRYLKNKLILRGTLNFSAASWERELDEGVKFKTGQVMSDSESKILDMLEFNLQLVGKENIHLNNSNGKANGEFDLRLSGSPAFPIITGYIESRQGELYFFDTTFNIIKAKFTFANKYLIDPVINIESEAFLKNYRIKFNIKGNSSRYKPEFKSSPQLPPQDILALISLGELFSGPTSTQLSSRIGTGTTGLFATEILTNQIKKGTKKLFGNYMLKVDPTAPGSSFNDTAKIIIGKSIAKDFLVVYSTSFSPSQKEVWYIKYQISPSISLIGMKNEE